MLKKISIFLLVFVMVLAMTIPSVFAASLPIEDLPNKVILQYREEAESEYDYYYINWSFGDDYLDYGYIALKNENNFHLKSYKEIYGYYGKLDDDGSVSWVLDRHHTQGSGFNVRDKTDIYFSTVDVSDYTNYSQIVYPSDVYCDGFFCQTVDANSDGYCEECGRMVRNFVAPVPNPPSGSGSSYALWYNDDGSYYAMTNFYPSDSFVELYADSQYRIHFKLSDTAVGWVYSGDGVWSITNSDILGNDYFIGISDKSHLIHYPDTLTFNGEDFFVPPLTLERAALMGIQNLLEKMGAALLILVGLGVSLMALWIGLSLFGKVLYRFLH